MTSDLMEQHGNNHESFDHVDSPSFDLADLSLGTVAFVAALFLLLEIGGALVMSGRLFPGIADRGLSGSLAIEAGVVVIEIALITLLLGMERVHPVAAGLKFRDIPRGLLIGAAIWGLCQLSLAVVALGRHGSLSLYVGWAEPAAMIAPLLRRFLTDVFAEEMFWRGILFIWILRQLDVRRWHDPLSRIGAALLASQILFGLTRLPTQILDGSARMIPPGAALVAFTVTGIFYALIYLRTNNIWLVMVVHTLSLWPLPLFAFELDPSKLVILISAVLLIPTRRSQSSPPGRRRGSSQPRLERG